MPVRRVAGLSFVGARGFTLMEAIVTMAIIGIVAAVATPRWLQNSADVEAMARQLQNDLRLAQNMAMTRGQRHRVYFDVATRYRLTDNAGVNVAHPLVPTGNVNFSSGVTIVANNFAAGYVAFDGRGVPYNGAAALTGATSVQIGKGGTTRTITVSQQTGYVTVTAP